LLALIFVFLTACSSDPSPNSPETSADSPTVSQSETTEREIEYVTSWGTDLLPDNFPAPPATMTMYSFSLDEHDETMYRKDAQVLTLTFTCKKPDFITFSNNLIQAGYKGGHHQVTDSDFNNGYLYGGWQDGKTAVILNGGVQLENHEFTYILEVSECYSLFPSGLDSLFPEFKGYSISPGKYSYKDIDGNYQFDDIPKDFSGKVWMLTHLTTDKNYYIGVTETEFTDYYEALLDAGFSGTIDYVNLDGANSVTLDVSKEDENGFLFVSMLYNISSQTLSAVYSNDYSYYNSLS